jgi:hypothetical protein
MRARVHVALLIQHVTHMRRIVTSFVAPLATPYFLDIINGTIFEENNI